MVGHGEVGGNLRERREGSKNLLMEMGRKVCKPAGGCEAGINVHQHYDWTTARAVDGSRQYSPPSRRTGAG
jgi:hypothetical protein